MKTLPVRALASIGPIAASLLAAATLLACAADVQPSDEGRAAEPSAERTIESFTPSQNIPGGGGQSSSVPSTGNPSNSGVGTSTGSTSTGSAPPACVAQAGGPSFCTNAPVNGLGLVIAHLVNAVSVDVCGGHTECGDYACNDATGKCMSMCLTTADCAVGYACNDGSCIVPKGEATPVSGDPTSWGVTSTAGACFPTSVFTCSDDHTEVNSCGTTRDCGDYACKASTGCATSCTTAASCASGKVCAGTPMICQPAPSSGTP
jgi:hypothetical protein